MYPTYAPYRRQSAIGNYLTVHLSLCPRHNCTKKNKKKNKQKKTKKQKKKTKKNKKKQKKQCSSNNMKL